MNRAHDPNTCRQCLQQRTFNPQSDKTTQFLAAPENRLLVSAAINTPGMVNLPAGVDLARLRQLVASHNPAGRSGS